MFALGFLLLLIIFFLLLAVISELFPKGRPRIVFILVVLGGIAAYPFAYKISPGYHSFLQLCEQPDRLQIMRRKPVDFIFIDWGYATDCSKGPALVDGRPYLGFDCLRAQQGGPKLYRYTKRTNWQRGCDLSCFEESPLDEAEASYKSEYRHGYIDGENPVVTYYRGVVTNARDGTKLSFNDQVLWSSGEMAYTRDYTYYPYGTGWAKILGMASGSPPSLSCNERFIQIDPRSVFPPKG